MPPNSAAISKNVPGELLLPHQPSSQLETTNVAANPQSPSVVGGAIGWR
jgi:hypothetical protein